MLFHTTFKAKAGFTHEAQKRTLELWAKWQPPKGFELKAFYMAADGRGFTIAEAETAEAAYEANAPWLIFFDWDLVPIVEIEKAVGITQKAIAFRESK